MAIDNFKNDELMEQEVDVTLKLREIFVLRGLARRRLDQKKKDLQRSILSPSNHPDQARHVNHNQDRVKRLEELVDILTIQLRERGVE